MRRARDIHDSRTMGIVDSHRILTNRIPSTIVICFIGLGKIYFPLGEGEDLKQVRLYVQKHAA